jgi:GTP cyclohydrolase I
MAHGTERGAEPEKTADSKQAEKPKRAMSKKALIKHVIALIGKKLENDELRPTVGDLARMWQLEKELLEETPKEIKVSWVEPEKEHASEK